MPKTLDLRKKEFDADRAYEVMMWRIREEILEEVALEFEGTYIDSSKHAALQAARFVRAMK